MKDMLENRVFRIALLIGLIGVIGVSAARLSTPRNIPARPESAPSEPVPGPARTSPPAADPPSATPDYEDLKREMETFIATRPGTFGIWFKDLSSGKSFGINESRPFVSASTVKVPIVLHLNELAARGEISLAERVAYNPDSDYQGGAGVLQFNAEAGDTYSLRVLANLAITISDNIATRMLIRRLGKENIAAFMRDLGGETVWPEGRNITTARDMGRYVEAVLDFARGEPELGGRLLDDMSHSIYHVALPGQLPPKVRVAHKEGDVWGMAGDVGVVYAERPYLLTVLIEGIEDLDRAFADIARISRLAFVYQKEIGVGGADATPPTE